MDWKLIVKSGATIRHILASERQRKNKPEKTDKHTYHAILVYVRRINLEEHSAKVDTVR